MKIVEPSYALESPIEGVWAHSIYRHIERIARKCYKSEGKITPTSAEPFVRKLVQVKKHESVIEHAGFSVTFIVDRGVSHEMVRHRLIAVSQESTRYCCYADDRFDGGVSFVRPHHCVEGTRDFYRWARICEQAETEYLALIKDGWKTEDARGALPHWLKTELTITANMREWRHIFRMRTAENAHPDMRRVMRPLLAEVKRHLPALFGDLP